MCELNPGRRSLCKCEVKITEWPTHVLYEEEPTNLYTSHMILSAQLKYCLARNGEYAMLMQSWSGKWNHQPFKVWNEPWKSIEKPISLGQSTDSAIVPSCWSANVWNPSLT